MVRAKESEVLVVGAGPVGMFAALLLARRGVEVAIVDEAWRTTTRSYALALHPATLALLGEVGLADDLVAHGQRVERIAFYEGGERCGELALGDLGGAYPFLLILPQDRLERLLEDQLFDLGVRVRWNQRLAGLEPAAGDGVAARLEELGKESLGYGVMTREWVVERRVDHRTSFVIGADGHRSRVRRLLGIEFERLGEGGDEVYAVFEMTTDHPPPQEERVVLSGRTANVLWPLGEQRCRWSFQELDPASLVARRAKGRLAVQVGPDAYPFLDRDDLLAYATERAPWFETEAVRDIAWSVAVRFEHRLAERFGEDRVWLAGDAAHLAGPIGVHSMNNGLAEAADLARLMVEALPGGALEGLEEYGRTRGAVWRLLLGADGPPATAAGAPGWVGRHPGRVLSALPFSGPGLVAAARQLGLALPES
jgi:2-polyprenyl-6-methoxyphenol hydroxylase-like FAD-dependent oxidoreductase